MTYTDDAIHTRDPKARVHADGSPCHWHTVVPSKDHPTESLTEYWQRQLDLATERAVAAAEDSVKAAVLLLAYGARECIPGAKRINLSESDQGEWLWVDDIDGIDQSDESQPVLQRSFDDHYGPAASCLYLARLDASPYLHLDENLSSRRDPRYYIDIQEALA